MWLAEIATRWQGDGKSTETGFGPLLGTLLTRPGEGFGDVTAQPSANLKPDPNCYVVRVRCEGGTLDVIEADSRFLVLWCEEEAEDAF